MADYDFPPLAIQTDILLNHYAFELDGQVSGDFVQAWLEEYPPTWLRAAVIESLYQGRYKAKSVSQILRLWSRRDRPLRHFSHEFESIICRELPYPEFSTCLAEFAATPPSLAAAEPAPAVAAAPDSADTTSPALDSSRSASPDPAADSPIAPAVQVSGDAPIRDRCDPSGAMPEAVSPPAIAEVSSLADAMASGSPMPSAAAADSPRAEVNPGDPNRTEPIPPFAPQAEALGQSLWFPPAAALSAAGDAAPPIDEFMPTADLPPSYAKLQAVVRQGQPRSPLS